MVSKIKHIKTPISLMQELLQLIFRYYICKSKNAYKQRFNAFSCSTNPLSKLLTIIFTKIKGGLKRYIDTISQKFEIIGTSKIPDYIQGFFN